MELTGFAWKLADIIFIVNIFLVAIVVIFERRNPVATVAWILLLVFVPNIRVFSVCISGTEPAAQKTLLLERRGIA